MYLLLERDEPGDEGESFDSDAVSKRGIGTDIEAKLDQRGQVGHHYTNVTFYQLIK